jgi:hypothetical protein
MLFLGQARRLAPVVRDRDLEASGRERPRITSGGHGLVVDDQHFGRRAGRTGARVTGGGQPQGGTRGPFAVHVHWESAVSGAAFNRFGSEICGQSDGFRGHDAARVLAK